MSRVVFIVMLCAYLLGMMVLTFSAEVQSATIFRILGPLAFAPLGALFLFLLGRRRWWVAVTLAAVSAVWVEAAQSAWMPIGYASLTDAAWEGFAAVAGVGIGVAALSSRVPPRAGLASKHDG